MRKKQPKLTTKPIYKNGYESAQENKPRYAPHRAGTTSEEIWLAGYNAYQSGGAMPEEPRKKRKSREPSTPDTIIVLKDKIKPEDKIVFPFQLDAEDKWYLGADGEQWIIYRRRVAKGKEQFAGQSFIADDKRILHRCIREHGITLTAEATAMIDSLPDNFMEFKAIYNPKSGKGRKKGYKPSEK